MKVLVTGGAGYIGSHTVKALVRRGFDPVVLDDLSEGHRAAVPEGVELVEGDCGSPEVLDGVLGRWPVEGVIHFAARCYVGESVQEPLLYWRKNVGTTLALLERMAAHGVGRFIFSSSCAVYGEPGDEDLREDRPRRPVNPYGRTKATVEEVLEDLDRAGALRFGALRYFNAAGADPEGVLGEDHDPETHLLPRAILAALGRAELTVFGDDYATPDGTCVRDYVHVSDLAEAHVLALARLGEGAPSLRVNLGTGRGHSVRELIDAVAERAGRPVPHDSGPRRPGDPARLVAKPGLAEEVLGWRPEHSSLAELVGTAWEWFARHPEGYPS